MERKEHKILEIKEHIYDRHPDLVERIRRVQERVNQARSKLHGSGIYERNTLTDSENFVKIFESDAVSLPLRSR